MAEIDVCDTSDFTTINSGMPYLDAVIMETNRLHPVIHAVVRSINRNVVLRSGPTPVQLKPGMLLYLSLLYVNTSPKYWGPDAREFVPGRWLEGDVEGKAFMGFGYGPRSCVSLCTTLLNPS